MDALPDFLKPKAIKDIQGRRPTDDGYDDTSLLIPASKWQTFTPAMS